VDLLTAGAEVATLLQSAAVAVPPGVKRRWPNRRRRADAYLRLQCSAVEVMSWLVQSRTLIMAAPQPAPKGVLVAALFAAAAPGRMTPEYTRPVLRQIALARMSLDYLADGLYQKQLLHELRDFRQATACYLGALAEVRLHGRPVPRVAAERLTAVLAECAGAIPEVNTKAPVLRARRPLEGSSWLYFDRSVRAVGELQRQFTIAARDDLGSGKRVWHIGRKSRTARWQIWREAPWPGGWPGPDGTAPYPGIRTSQSAASARYRKSSN
jgi:hypothetical protein